METLDKLQNYENQIENLIKEGVEKDNYIRTIRRRTMDLDDEMANAVEEYKQKINEQTDAVDGLSREIKELKREKEEYASEIASLKNEVEKLKLELNNNEIMRRNMLVSIETLTQESDMYSSEAKKLRIELAATRESLSVKPPSTDRSQPPSHNQYDSLYQNLRAEFQQMFARFEATITEKNSNQLFRTEEVAGSATTSNVTIEHNLDNHATLSSGEGKTAGEVIFIKPKQKQESKKTKEEVQRVLKPSTLKVGITQVSEITNGGIVIKCKTKQDQETIKKAAESQLNHYQVTTPQLKDPCFKILDMEEGYTNDVLIDYIKRQNSSILHESSSMTVKVVKRMKKTFMAIVECDPKTFKGIIAEKYLYINWSRCRIFEYVGVYRCFKCGGFGHHASKCSSEEKCLKCSSANHKIDSCVSEHYVCFNCSEANLSLKLSLDVSHSIFDYKCPVYLKNVEREKRKVKSIE
nr:unnamed protein product [Callosobruchus analis]